MIRYTQTAPTRWINGKGQTTELISWERSASLTTAPTPAWRLSIARLEGAAAFSAIPQVQRRFLPIGTTVLLSVNGIPRRVADHTSTEFAGDDSVELLDLHPRPGHAINLMIRDTPAPSSIAVAVCTTAGDIFRTCVAAIALESAPGIGVFDIVTPDSPEVGGRTFSIAALQLTEHG